jgi:hypothetical protein
VEIPALRKFSFRKFWPEIPALYRRLHHSLRERTQRKFAGPEILEFLAPENSGFSEFLAPFPKAAPQPFVKDLAEFLRAGNYGISGPQKFCQTIISGPFTERCTTTFCKGLSRISKGRKFSPRKFCPGAEIPALGAEFPAQKANFWPSKRHSSG